MSDWPPLHFNPHDPDWTNVARAAAAAGMSEKAIYENIEGYGVYWFGRWYVSQERLFSTAWPKRAKKKKSNPDQGSLDI